MPVGGRGQEVSADWKCPTDGFQVTTIRRVLERGANESLRCVAGRRGWERRESGRSNRVKIEPETRSPARGEPRASSDAASLLRPIQGEGRGPSPPLGAAGFRGQILGLPTKGLRESGGLLFFLGRQGIPKGLEYDVPLVFGQGMTPETARVGIQ